MSIKKTLKYAGYFILLVLLLFVGFVIYPFSAIKPPPQNGKDMIIKNINIVDVTKDTILKNKHILIKEDRVSKISDNAFEFAESDTKIIDGTNKFVMSGLWDMHAHLFKQAPHVDYPEYLRYGVTHVRDLMGAYNERSPFAGSQERIEKWNNQVIKQEIIGPRTHGFASFPVEGSSPMFKNCPDFFNCATPKDAKKLVQFFNDKGVTLIKVYNNISKDAFFTLMKEAKKLGIEVSGHKPVRVSTIDASNAGMKTLEHARFFIWDSFKGAALLRQSDNPKGEDCTQLRATMLQQHDSTMLYNMFDTFVKNNTWYCPTHLTRKADAYADNEAFRKRYDHINSILRMFSFEDLDGVIYEDTTSYGRKIYKDFYLKGLEITGQASKHGVKLLAGSDVPELPGSTLHEELQELSKAGLTNYEVLRTATLNPAIYYNLEHLYGSVSENKIADLVILSKNPISDIKNTTSITGIINNGVYLNNNYLYDVKDKINNRRKSLHMNAKLIWDILIHMTT
ncbi:amidohydrolase family protein [Flavivirga algicola]|uniref:Amidohydrolase family protein n=1 Tax=Flavivirga algicola TaxID=2729136 RepID=A0ABX1RUT6_9FLAO|nr:amidohydrolase family protein [Flavivirga algicola]NMH87315.1 amidohydrolase family protein [Flavivirga algicola]